MGCLPKLLTPLGFDENSVRVAVQRLVAEGWLTSQTEGRRRNLCITDANRAETMRVQSLVYCDAVPDWNGTWLLMRVAPETAADREAVRRVLQQHGFAPFSPGVFVHPQAEWGNIKQIPAIKRYKNAITTVFEASELSDRAELVDLWDTEAMAARWRQIDQYLDMTRCAGSPSNALGCRLLLVHEVRRLVLAYPSLPAIHLPAGWPEDSVRRRFCAVYRELFEAAQDFLDSHVVLSDRTRPHWHGFEPPRFGRDDFVAEARQTPSRA